MLSNPFSTSQTLHECCAQVLEKLNNVSCGQRCVVGSGGKSVGEGLPLHLCNKGRMSKHCCHYVMLQIGRQPGASPASLHNLAHAALR